MEKHLQMKLDALQKKYRRDYGVKGMKWGHHKAKTEEPTSSNKYSKMSDDELDNTLMERLGGTDIDNGRFQELWENEPKKVLAYCDKYGLTESPKSWNDYKIRDSIIDYAVYKLCDHEEDYVKDECRELIEGEMPKDVAGNAIGYMIDNDIDPRGLDEEDIGSYYCGKDTEDFIDSLSDEVDRCIKETKDDAEEYEHWRDFGRDIYW